MVHNYYLSSILIFNDQTFEIFVIILSISCVGGGLIESYYFIFLGEISELMINNSAVRKMYSNLVPGEVSHKHFWARYFYKVQRFFYCK